MQRTAAGPGQPRGLGSASSPGSSQRPSEPLLSFLSVVGDVGLGVMQGGRGGAGERNPWERARGLPKCVKRLQSRCKVPRGGSRERGSGWMSPGCPEISAAPRQGGGFALGGEQGWPHPARLLGQDPLRPHCGTRDKGLWPPRDTSSSSICPAGSGGERSAQERDLLVSCCLTTAVHPSPVSVPGFQSCFSSSPRPWCPPLLLIPASPAPVDQWGNAVAESSACLSCLPAPVASQNEWE